MIAVDLVHEVADRAHDLDVGALAAGADIVFLAGPAVAENLDQSAGMVVDIKPVPDIFSAPVDSDRLAFERVENGERNELLGKLVGPKIVAAVRDDDRQPIRAVPSDCKVIGGGLAGGVG